MYNTKNWDSYLEIIVHETCNLKCSYCIESQLEENVHLKLEDNQVKLGYFKKAIDLFCERGKHLHINLFGGEPLLVPKLYLDIIQYIAGKIQDGFSISLSTTTNCVNLTEEVIHQLKDYLQYYTFFVVSLDSSNPLGNVERFGKVSAKLTSRILKTITLLEHYLRDRLTIRTTVTETSLPFLYETASYFLNQFKYLRYSAFPVDYERNFGKKTSSELFSTYYEVLLKIYIKQSLMWGSDFKKMKSRISYVDFHKPLNYNHKQFQEFLTKNIGSEKDVSEFDVSKIGRCRRKDTLTTILPDGFMVNCYISYLKTRRKYLHISGARVVGDLKSRLDDGFCYYVHSIEVEGKKPALIGKL